MNILVVSYVDCITTQIEGVVKRSGKDAKIDIAKGTCEARYLIGMKEYELIIIDMMVQEYNNKITKPILEPAILFLKQLKNSKILTKVFSLFNEDETGKKGQEKISDLGYEIAAYDGSSTQWEEKLLNYI